MYKYVCVFVCARVYYRYVFIYKCVCAHTHTHAPKTYKARDFTSLHLGFVIIIQHNITVFFVFT